MILIITKYLTFVKTELEKINHEAYQKNAKFYENPLHIA